MTPGVATFGSLCALLSAACVGGALAPAHSCLTVGFAAWSGAGPTGLAPPLDMLPDVRLTRDRAAWPPNEAWLHAPPAGTWLPVGTPGRDTASIWLAPARDSLILLKVGETPWALYVAGAWRGDTLFGRADYWEREPGSESHAAAYGVLQDCSSFGAVAAVNGLRGLLARAVTPADTAARPLPERAQRLRRQP